MTRRGYVAAATTCDGPTGPGYSWQDLVGQTRWGDVAAQRILDGLRR